MQLKVPDADDTLAVYWILFELNHSHKKINPQSLKDNFSTHFEKLTVKRKWENATTWLLQYGLIIKLSEDSYEITTVGAKVVQGYFEKIHMDIVEYQILGRRVPTKREYAYAFDFLDTMYRDNGTIDENEIDENGKISFDTKFRVVHSHFFLFLDYVREMRGIYGFTPSIFAVIESMN
jgi:hypothetical protein